MFSYNGMEKTLQTSKERDFENKLLSVDINRQLSAADKRPIHGINKPDEHVDFKQNDLI